MIKTDLPIYLASSSPRRKKLLQQLNLRFKTFTVECEENIEKGETPLNAVKRLAKKKLSIARTKIKNGIIITADTVVAVNGKIIGKPVDGKDAERILKQLSGKTHTVYTGFSIFNSRNNKSITGYEKTLVTFRRLGQKEIRKYIETGSPMDKAGAYGIQDDYGAVFVEKINGCYNNVVGLPLTKFYKALIRII
jgi:septum formation protein